VQGSTWTGQACTPSVVIGSGNQGAILALRASGPPKLLLHRVPHRHLALRSHLVHRGLLRRVAAGLQQIIHCSSFQLERGVFLEVLRVWLYRRGATGALHGSGALVCLRSALLRHIESTAATDDLNHLGQTTPQTTWRQIRLHRTSGRVP
jgi:hypothetical protein